MNLKNLPEGCSHGCFEIEFFSGVLMPISIVMPTYNRLSYLREAVDSVLAQSYTEWELIISDDGSKDGTREYLRSLSDPRIRVYFQNPNLGQFGNFNFLFQQVKYDIAQILCDDDFFADSEALGRLMEQWAALPPDVAFVRANHSRANSQCSLTRYECEVLPERIAPADSDLYFAIFGSLSGCISNISVRTAVMRENQFRTDLPYAGDFEMWSRLAHEHSFVMSEVALTTVRQHEAQVSATFNRDGQLVGQQREILEPMYERLMAAGRSAFLLRLMYTLNYSSYHRYAAIKSLLRRGNGAYLGKVVRELDRSPASLGPVLSWLVFFASAGGRLFRVPVARRLLAGNRVASARAS